MHFTLTRRANVAFIVVWGLAASIFIILSRPRPFLCAVIGCIAGLAVGLLQRGSVRASPDLFAQTKSALDVRRAFMSNRAGKASIALQWATGFALVVVGLAGSGNPFVAAIAGYVTFMFVREVTSFGAIGAMAQGPRDSQHAF